jgi:hypothetical protein
MHLRVEQNRCGQPHCRTCRNQPPRRLARREVAGLIAFFAGGAILLVMLVVALAFPR